MFLDVTIIISWCRFSLILTWCRRGRFADNLMPNWCSIYTIYCCLINPWVHSLWIYSWIFLIILILMKTMLSFRLFNLWILLLRWLTWSWKFIIKHTISYELIYFRINFFMCDIIVFFIILKIKCCSFRIWVSYFRIWSGYCRFRI